MTEQQRQDAERAKKVVEKAQLMCQEAIGAPFAVRTGKNSVTRGTIVECTVAGLFNRGDRARTIEARFRVTLETGALKLRQSFTVHAIPAFSGRRVR